MRITLNGTVWDTEQISQVGQQAVAVAGRIEAQLEALQAEYTKLASTYEGLSADEQQQLFRQWRQETEDLHMALTRIGQDMQTIAANYEAAERASMGA